jgi:hypothetical protein
MSQGQLRLCRKHPLSGLPSFAAGFARFRENGWKRPAEYAILWFTAILQENWVLADFRERSMLQGARDKGKAEGIFAAAKNAAAMKTPISQIADRLAQCKTGNAHQRGGRLHARGKLNSPAF